MSDFDRYGGTFNDDRDRMRDRDRRWLDRGRGGSGIFPERTDQVRSTRPDQRSGFFPSDRDDRGSYGPERDRAASSSSRTEPRFGGRDRPRERMFRDNQPGDRGGGFFGGDREDRGHRHSRDTGRETSRFDNDDENRDLPIDETEQLIASNKVEGTPVYGREGERLGTIYNFMVDKYSGRVTYAVMSYGGFLGVGQRYYPLPWRILSYDTREGGYRVDMDYRDMERAPSFGREDEPRFNRDYDRRVHNYYGLDY